MHDWTCGHRESSIVVVVLDGVNFPRILRGLRGVQLKGQKRKYNPPLRPSSCGELPHPLLNHQVVVWGS